MKKIKKQLPFLLIFILGFCILLYPQISRLYYKIEANDIITNFDLEKSKLTDKEILKRFELAESYNYSLSKDILDDPYNSSSGKSEAKIKEGRAAYAHMLEIKEYIGYVEIPKINEKLPIFAGTTEEVLQKGVGHLEGTSLPIGGKGTHTVLTAHTGLPQAKLFTDLDKLEKGDIFYIHNFKEILAYKVDSIKVIEPSNFDDLIIKDNSDYATLLTCTPYMVNSHRLLVRGYRIPYQAEEHIYNKSFLEKYYPYIIILLILLFILALYYLRKKKRSITFEN